MVQDLLLEQGRLVFRRERAVDEEVCCLEVVGVQSELFDWVSSVSQHYSSQFSDVTLECIPIRCGGYAPPASPSIYVISLLITAVFRYPLSAIRRPLVVSFSGLSPGLKGALISLNAVAAILLSAILQTCPKGVSVPLREATGFGGRTE